MEWGRKGRQMEGKGSRTFRLPWVIIGWVMWGMLFLPQTGIAQEKYPAKPISFVVGYTSGRDNRPLRPGPGGCGE